MKWFVWQWENTMTPGLCHKWKIWNKTLKYWSHNSLGDFSLCFDYSTSICQRFSLFLATQNAKKSLLWIMNEVKGIAISYANFRVTRFKGFHYKSLQLWSLSRSIGALANMCQHFFPNNKGKICKEYVSSWRSPFFLLLTNFHLFWWTIFQHDSLGFPTLPSYILYLPIHRESYLGGVVWRRGFTG
jgi:hypothetical protein